MAECYDLIVIGAGPGGYPAALKAASLGKRVAVVESRELGGTCLNRGCIPTKTFLHTTSLFREVTHGEMVGLEVHGAAVHAESLKMRKQQVVETLRSGIEKQFIKNKIDLYYGIGSVTGAHEVLVSGTEPVRLEGHYILIATGSRPSIPPIPGADLPGVVDSDQLLEEVDLGCKQLIIIGGGVIGMEFAQIYSDLGCQVTVLEAMDRILPNMEKELAQNLKMILKKRGVEIHTGAKVQAIRCAESKLLCVYEEKGVEAGASGEKILIATGRKPNTEGLFAEGQAEAVGLAHGYIPVDDHFLTRIPDIYAIGDVIGGVQLAHVATAEGICAVEDMFRLERTFDMSVVPSCVYTDPEIATVGDTEESAKEKGLETRTGKYIMSVNGKSFLSAQERGFVKLVAEAEGGRIIGAQLMCARATDLIAELELAIQKKMSAQDLAAVMMPHPTFCEGIREAAEAILEKEYEKR
ncbi:MAG: dihydrolipoyl dehydrogenase [Hungatella sp.]